MATSKGKGLSASKRAAKAPSPPVVVQAAPVPAPAPVEAAPKPAVVATTVALRGGLAIANVKLTGKAYRVGAAHNAGWWKQVEDAIKAGNGQAPVAELVKAGVPAIFIGYVVRRGYAQSA